jgi:hypothetical protein
VIALGIQNENAQFTAFGVAIGQMRRGKNFAHELAIQRIDRWTIHRQPADIFFNMITNKLKLSHFSPQKIKTRNEWHNA